MKEMLMQIIERRRVVQDIFENKKLRSKRDDDGGPPRLWPTTPFDCGPPEK